MEIQFQALQEVQVEALRVLKKKKKQESNVGRAQRCFRGYCRMAAIHKPQLKITTSLFVRV